LALSLFPEHDESISNDDEEYGIYNLFFQLRGEFAEAISNGDHKTAAKILDFSGRCLLNELASDGEDISAAAGVSLFEHIFEDSPPKHWRAIFSSLPHRIYLACHPYPEQWMGSDAFSRVEAAAAKCYGLPLRR
jgi:hypothetical protein